MKLLDVAELIQCKASREVLQLGELVGLVMCAREVYYSQTLRRLGIEKFNNLTGNVILPCSLNKLNVNYFFKRVFSWLDFGIWATIAFSFLFNN